MVDRGGATPDWHCAPCYEGTHGPDVIASTTVTCPRLRFCPSYGPTWLRRTCVRSKSSLACAMADVPGLRMPTPSRGPGARDEETARESLPILRPARPPGAAGPIPVPGAAEPLIRRAPLPRREALPPSVPPFPECIGIPEDPRRRGLSIAPQDGIPRLSAVLQAAHATAGLPQVAWKRGREEVTMRA